MFFMFLVMGVLMAAGVIIIFQGKGSKKAKNAKQAKMYRKVYRFGMSFFLTRPHLMQIHKKLANLSIYRKDELQVEAARNLITSWGIGLALAGTSFFLFHDFLTVMICLLFSLLVTNIVVDKRIDRKMERLLSALSHGLGSLRQEYMRTNSVVEAFESAEFPPILKKVMGELSFMLTASNGEMKLQEFCESTPFRTIQTLAAISYSINNEGDEVDSHGQSNYVQALTLLLSDVNSEIQKNMYRKKRFGKIEYLPFMPIFGISLIETYFVDIMPGTALIYNGPIGYLARTITVVSAVIAYTVVSRINSTVPVKEDDRGTFVLTLLDNPKFKRFIKHISPKNNKKRKRAKIENKLKIALSRMTVEQFYAKKFVGGVMALLLAFLCAASTITLGRDFIENSTQQLSLVATAEMNSVSKASIRQLDETYLADPASFNDQQVVDLVRTHMSGLSDLQIQDQVKRLKDKAKSLENAYFKWWYMWVCFGVGYMGWMLPNMSLKIRGRLILTEEEDDFLQIQTLASILMNTNIDTIGMLKHFAQHSRVHKPMFTYAYQGYPSNPELEISRLQSKTPLIAFRRFIGKLKLTISDLSMREAFSDLLIEREHILRMRDMAITASINAKRSMCGPLAMVPLAAMIIGEFLIPIGILGYNEFMGALKSM